jgi:hypothetical protein
MSVTSEPIRGRRRTMPSGRRKGVIRDVRNSPPTKAGLGREGGIETMM